MSINQFPDTDLETQHWPKHGGNLTWCGLVVKDVPHKPHRPGYHPLTCHNCIMANGQDRATCLTMQRQIHTEFFSDAYGIDLPVTELSRFWWAWYSNGVADGIRGIYLPARANEPTVITEAYDAGHQDGTMDQILHDAYVHAKGLETLF